MIERDSRSGPERPRPDGPRRDFGGERSGQSAPTAAPRAAFFFALLLTDHVPASDTLLVTSADEPWDVRLRCEIIAENTERGLALMTVTPASMLPFRTPRVLQVQRGRRGAKAAEKLLILQAIPQRLLAQNTVQRKGSAKAILRALDSICPEGHPTSFDGWMAVELATVGFVSRASALKMSKECDATPPEAGGELLRADQLLIWKDYLERETDRMQAMLEKQIAVNPLLDRLDLLHVASALGTPLRPLCLRVLLNLGLRWGAREERSLLGQYFALGAKSGTRREATDEEKLLVAQILKDYENSDGARLQKLKEAHPSHLHIVDWMLKSHLLFETPSGYVLTRRQLDTAYAIFKVSTGQPGAPGVGEIKQRLGWGRSLAEALRELLASEDLLEQVAIPPRPPEPRGRSRD